MLGNGLYDERELDTNGVLDNDWRDNTCERDNVGGLICSLI